MADPPLGATPKLSTPADYTPIVEQAIGNRAGVFAGTPQGVILHGSRSGQDYDTDREYQATVNYYRQGANGLGWNATIGDDRVCEHLTAAEWGWNARSASRQYLAVEFAQATVDRPISDGQVRAFSWLFRNRFRGEWPSLPQEFPMHSELPQGVSDGKTDPHVRGGIAGEKLRARIVAEIARQGG